jgi:hypothetical protein
MIDQIIPKSNGRYAISKDGKVYSKYRKNNNGTVRPQCKELAKLVSNTDYSTCYVQLKLDDGRTIKPTVFSLMELCFELGPPDPFHRYVGDYKDGDFKNHSLENLAYRLVVLSEYDFPVEVFHEGEALEKRCGWCGCVQPIVNFRFQSSKTYRNSCSMCLDKRRWQSIQNDSSKLERHRKRNNIRQSGEDYYRKFNQYSRLYTAENKNSYINKVIRNRGLNPEVFTEEMKNVVRVQLLIDRELKSR